MESQELTAFTDVLVQFLPRHYDRLAAAYADEGSELDGAADGSRDDLILLVPQPRRTMLLPVIGLGQDNRWIFAGPSQWGVAVLSVAGWTMTAAALACLPRVLRRR